MLVGGQGGWGPPPKGALMLGLGPSPGGALNVSGCSRKAGGRQRPITPRLAP